MVVDDNEATRLLVQAALRREGFQTDSARDGAEAIQLLGRYDGYELIVLDLMMPNVDGYGVLEYLGSGEGFPPSLRKILLVTASPHLIDGARLPKEICEVLFKPFSGELLIEHVS